MPSLPQPSISFASRLIQCSHLQVATVHTYDPSYGQHRPQQTCEAFSRKVVATDTTLCVPAGPSINCPACASRQSDCAGTPAPGHRLWHSQTMMLTQGGPGGLMAREEAMEGCLKVRQLCLTWEGYSEGHEPWHLRRRRLHEVPGAQSGPASHGPPE